MARRDRLDVALFQHRGVGEPGAGGLRFGDALLPRYRLRRRCAGYAAAGCGEGPVVLVNSVGPDQ